MSDNLLAGGPPLAAPGRPAAGASTGSTSANMEEGPPVTKAGDSWAYTIATGVRTVSVTLMGLIFWIGLWTFLDESVLLSISLYASSPTPLRDILYAAVGGAGTWLSRHLLRRHWRQGITWAPHEFHLLRKAGRAAATALVSTCAITLWTGLWNLFTAAFTNTMGRNVRFIFGSLYVLLMVEVFLHPHSIRYFLNLRPDDDQYEEADMQW